MTTEHGTTLEVLMEQLVREIPLVSGRFPPHLDKATLTYVFAQSKAFIEQDFHDVARFFAYSVGHRHERASPDLPLPEGAAFEKFNRAAQCAQDLLRHKGFSDAEAVDLYSPFRSVLAAMLRAEAEFVLAECERAVDDGRVGVYRAVSDDMGQCKFYNQPAHGKTPIAALEAAARGEPFPDADEDDEGTTSQHVFELFVRRSLSFRRSWRVRRRFPAAQQLYQSLPSCLEPSARLIFGHHFDAQHGAAGGAYVLVLCDRYILNQWQAAQFSQSRPRALLLQRHLLPTRRRRGHGPAFLAGFPDALSPFARVVLALAMLAAIVACYARFSNASANLQPATMPSTGSVSPGQNAAATVVDLPGRTMDISALPNPPDYTEIRGLFHSEQRSQ